jgi:hypothetical protein
VPLLQDMECVMQSIESFDGLTYLDTGSHIFRTLDDGQMGLDLIDMAMMAHLWAGIPYSRQCTHILPSHLMEYVALGLAWTACRDEMHPLSTLDATFYTLDIGLLTITSCASLMEMMGFACHMDTT